MIERENTFTMEEFSTSINEFLSFRRYQILKDKGKISRLQAEQKAEAEYDEFNKTQKRWNIAGIIVLSIIAIIVIISLISEM